MVRISERTVIWGCRNLQDSYTNGFGLFAYKILFKNVGVWQNLTSDSFLLQFSNEITGEKLILTSYLPMVGKTTEKGPQNCAQIGLGQFSAALLDDGGAGCARG